ncbi:RND family efflux transporter, MFP subunit [Marinospirillum celere]|uniref:RND family efflux transporter, MFP subunit n=1 Tax=Marinospirillum celere TaxID=1122252 RepID=A0A1I1G5P0_9GAMM|nr:efflux RND transporter periplasmic adaptor subunit [Marinospirillum celere]SFC06642.1 RND family efflux transporter, MFP subunit [Marinospirillum celere]
MKPITRLLPHQVVGVLLLLVVGQMAWAEATTPLSSVRVMTLGASEVSESRRFVGRVDAISSVDLAFQVGGKIQELSLQQGVKVAEGELLAALDPVDYQLAVERAEIEVARAQRDKDRKLSLYERNSIPRAALDEAQDQLRLAEVALSAAQRDLDHTRMQAPFDALVSRRLQEKYALIQAGTPVVRVQDVTELRVHISVPEDLIHRITRPDDFQAWLKLSGREPLELEYREHVTEPDPVVQTYEVTLGRDQLPDLALLPGRTVTVVVEARQTQQQQLEIPVGALNGSSDGHFFVWIYNPETRKVNARPVEVGPLQGNRVKLLAGVEPGEQLVTAGGQRLHEGMKVKPFEHF